MNNTYASVGQSAQAMKQASVIENELDMLRKRVSIVNDLTRTIADKLWVPGPENEKSQILDRPSLTLSDHLRVIRSNTDIALEKLESIAKCLDEQLGGLKLEG